MQRKSKSRVYFSRMSVADMLIRQGVNTDQIFAENVSLKAKIREIKESVRNTDRITTVSCIVRGGDGRCAMNAVSFFTGLTIH